MLLQEYTQEVGILRGVGPVLKSRLACLGVSTICDLLRHFPRDYQDRRRRDRLSEAGAKERANVLVRVASKQWVGRSYPKVLKVIVEDDSGRAALVCYGRPYLGAVLLPGRLFWVFGKFNLQFGELQSGNFEAELYDPKEENRSFGRILPLYPLTEGLTQKSLRRLIGQALQRVRPRLEDELPAALRERYGFSATYECLRAIHFPRSDEELEAARKALTYTELFYYQLAFGRVRQDRLSITRSRAPHEQTLKAALLQRLPFRLTADQEKVLAEIEADLFSPHPGARLLQGEVGSGKTLVCFLAALSVIEAGEQAALLAPTELLARQHADNAARLLEPLGVQVALLSGTVQGGERESLRRSLAAGEVRFIVGTHALYSEDIRYRKLGLVIVDEQQRFGVRQRQALLAKGAHPDLLLMTATPIPRTLALALFGDLELSEIRELPQGRRPVITHLARQGSEAKVYDRVREQIRQGGQAYFVYPLIGESETLELKNAEGMFRTLRAQVFADLRLGLIHSRVPEEEKLNVMAGFLAGRIDILVATSVMEVGVDVPNASAVVIEHAERFGLSNLHQLRGRVGRGERQSYAYLVYSAQLTETAVQRLKAIKDTTDGFAIAEEDLKIRGPGEFLGLRQSGFFKLGLADLARDWDTFLKARTDAFALLAKDPGLLYPENSLYREVLRRMPPLAAMEDNSADHGWAL